MTTYLQTESFVHHMEADRFMPNNILSSDGAALKTTDGLNVTTIAGNSTKMGYRNGQNALFYQIHGFTQISPTEVVATDLWNFCLRLIDRQTIQTYRYAGHCGRSGFADGTNEAKFSTLRSILTDWKQPGLLFVTDPKNNAIRYVDTSTSNFPVTVSTFFKSSDLIEPNYIAQHPITADLYITTSENVYKLTYVLKTLSVVLYTSLGMSVGIMPSKSPQLKEIRIVAPDTLMVAARSDSRIRLLDTDGNQTDLLCSGQAGHHNGDRKTCSLNRPVSLMILNGALYIGEEERIRKIRGNI